MKKKRGRRKRYVERENELDVKKGRKRHPISKLINLPRLFDIGGVINDKFA